MSHRPSWSRWKLTVAAGVVSALALLPAIASSQLGSRGGSDGTVRESLTPLTLAVIDAPSAVRATDGRRHLAYEVAMFNPTSFEVSVERIRTIDPATGDVVNDRDAGAIAEHMRRFGGLDVGGSIPPGGTGVQLLDISFPGGTRVPRRLVHRVRVSIDGDAPNLAISFSGGRTRVVAERPAEVSAPLRGTNWVVGNGCCEDMTAHRTAILPVNGALHLAERFAIDFVQLDENGRLFNGPVDQLASYGYFGDDVLSVSDGLVVATQDGLPDNVPGAFPPGATAATAGGNYVVVAMGGDRFAFYAHLIPGSLEVSVGDRVDAGQMIGLLGNSGNSDAPHLHFHVMNGRGALSSDGLPYTFDRGRVLGTVTNLDQLFGGGVATLDSALAGAFGNRLPLDLQVVRFRA